MEILYKSTRGSDKNVSASQAILDGIASDGGLFVPDRIPLLSENLEDLKKCSYQQLAYVIMSKFFTDYSEDELKYCINSAYDHKFDTETIAPLRVMKTEAYLELFHGKTIAFKDMALSVLPYLMTTAAKKNNVKEKIVILTATSGDTGKAALAGFADVPGTRIVVFYPKDGVSQVQRLQMVTQKGDNTCVIAIKGNFDDAQTGVKKMFSDKKLKKDLLARGYRFSSANSINIGRLVPQIVYYVYAYLELANAEKIQIGDKINIVVPTGNFGNILAAYYAKLMGLPVNKLICASNQNKVLFDFFKTGTYDKNRKFYLSSSPSMDILVSSNLERLIYMAADSNPEITATRMRDLNENGRYSISRKCREKLNDFVSGFASEEESARAIKKLYEEENYVIDPHTSVGTSVYHKYREETGDYTPTIIASTASPYKFARSVLEAIDAAAYASHTDLEQIKDLEKITAVPAPTAVTELQNAKIRHTKVSEIFGMQAAVREELSL